MRLARRYVEKPWGRIGLPPMFDPPPSKRIGEVWFEGGADLPLLAKYIFTSERLSIQVHPNDAQARKRGLVSGKCECWMILDASPGATIGLGLKHSVGEGELREAARDGSIEELIDWRPVSAGNFIFVPSATIHAIGGGISLLEFQQNADVTYRLYDYGRPRELHLDEAVAVASREPFADELVQHVAEREERTLVDGPHFILVLTHGDPLRDRRRWVIPLEGSGAGECFLIEPGERYDSAGNATLIGATAP